MSALAPPSVPPSSTRPGAGGASVSPSELARRRRERYESVLGSERLAEDDSTLAYEICRSSIDLGQEITELMYSTLSEIDIIDPETEETYHNILDRARALNQSAIVAGYAARVGYECDALTDRDAKQMCGGAAARAIIESLDIDIDPSTLTSPDLCEAAGREWVRGACS